jgi:hypothetical protein
MTSGPDRGPWLAAVKLGLAAVPVLDPNAGLATAYARVFESNGKSSAAARAVATQSRKVNAICPGAAS